MRRVLALLLIAGCAAPVEPVAPAPPGTAEAACAREVARRSGGAARIVSVQIFEDQRGIVKARAPFGTDYTCFTNPQGRVVNVAVDRRRF
ncbi:hypothetical protein ACVDG3_05905 [Meridianimarinicoccus sp. RP-17]|uniref:hypothetical protein n=1 Tax=Meridianimarinicoccus zhengii TaxID=2056810 RepID=UPI000DAD38A9|nr:hypothetical protein [Phycocomes zhengii]